MVGTYDLDAFDHLAEATLEGRIDHPPSVPRLTEGDVTMTLLVVGGTSRVGRVLVPLALRSRPVRVTTRDVGSPIARDLAAAGAEVVAADLRDRASLTRATRGVTAVVASAHGFPGVGDNDVESVDRSGHRNLIGAVRSAGASRFVYISAVGAAPDHPIDLFRAKYEIEQALASSDLEWTVLRATAFMESWAAMVGDPIRSGRRATVFGRGENPINLVAAGDVARLAVRLLDDMTSIREIVELGGPENLSMNEVVHRFGVATGTTPKVRHVSPAMMAVMRATAGRFNRPLARRITAGLVMDTVPLTFDAAPTLARWPMPVTALDDVIRASA
jgi:NADH dehydrogenase